MSKLGKPRQAATVVLVRPAEPRGFEVFLTRRPEGMAFLGGLYCFPGGAVSEEDCRSATIARAVGRTPKQAREIVGAAFTPEEAIGVWIAAVREVFEEVGVLLAAGHAGATLSMTPERAARLAERRGSLLNKSLSFAVLLESEQLYCDLASLSHFSYWQTPAQFALRFDTRFFLAALPPGQAPLATSYEVAHSVWLTPDHAMQLFNSGELPMIFPTFASLRTLADFDTLDSVVREFGLGK